MKTLLIETRKMGIAAALLLTAAAAFASASPAYAACEKHEKEQKGAVRHHGKTYKGTVRKLGNGMVRSWIKVDSGKLTAIGVTFDEKSLEGLPMEPVEGTEYLLHLPKEAKGLTVFNHVGLNWNPMGHPPETIYSVGHFDFHFYLISPEDRDRITAVGDDLGVSNKPLTAEFLPADYVMEPDAALPRMGSHWIDPNSKEFHGHGFTKTLIYGSYNGELTFIEPMITKAYLQTKPNVTVPIKVPAKYPKPGSYPTSYSVRYDEKKKEYTVSLEGMVAR